MIHGMLMYLLVLVIYAMITNRDYTINYLQFRSIINCFTNPNERVL